MSEEASVLSIGVSVDGAGSCDIRIELVSHIFTRSYAHREFKGLLDRPSRIRGVLEDVPTGVFSKASVCLLRRGGESSCGRLGTCQSFWGGTYEYGCQVVRAVVVWPCPTGFEGLLAIGIDLILVNAVKVFAKNVQSSTVVASQDLKGSDLVEVERTVVTNNGQG